MTPRDAADDNRGRWSDLDRPPLNATALRRALVREGGLWSGLEVVQRTGSTNDDLVARVAAGPVPEGAVLVAEEQTTGKGRLDRRWSAPPRCCSPATRASGTSRSAPSPPAWATSSARR